MLLAEVVWTCMGVRVQGCNLAQYALVSWTQFCKLLGDIINVEGTYECGVSPITSPLVWPWYQAKGIPRVKCWPKTWLLWALLIGNFLCRPFCGRLLFISDALFLFLLLNLIFALPWNPEIPDNWSRFVSMSYSDGTKRNSYDLLY